MNEVDYIRKKIKDKGYMTATQIILELNKNGTDIKFVPKILNLIVGDGFHKIKYTNQWVSPYKVKNLYYYNPNLKKRGRKATKSK
jgi:hypothetical protein